MKLMERPYMSSWGWVLIAWLQLVLAYGAYLLYLRWRGNQLEKDDD